MVDASKILEWLKLSPRYLLALALCTGVFPALSPPLLSRFGLDKIDAPVRPWIGVAFLASAALLVAHLLEEAAVRIGGVVKGRLEERNLCARLRDLSPDEKEVLAKYINEDTKTRYLSVKSGVTGGLEAAGILYRSANLGSINFKFAFNIQPWAWRHLRKHPELLAAVPQAAPSEQAK
jgi:hypothetical protein